LKAAVFKGPKVMEVEEVELSPCKGSEVLLKVEACAICGTDLRIFNHGHKSVKPPQTIGHEIAGTVVEVGPDASKDYLGQRVTVVTVVGCGRCIFCRKAIHNLCVDLKAIGYFYPGGFAEYVKIPSEAVRQGNLLPIPAELDAAEATLVEPLSCVINGQEYLDIKPGETVLVIGAGPIGSMHGRLAQIKGASRVIVADVSEKRLNLAEGFGFSRLINPQKENLLDEVMQITDGFGAEVVIVACSSKQAQQDSLAMVSRQGRISFFGGLPKDDPVIAFDSNILHYKEVSLYGAFASHASQYVQALSLITSRQFDASRFITQRFPLERIVEGIETVQRAEGLKSVILPQVS